MDANMDADTERAESAHDAEATDADIADAKEPGVAHIAGGVQAVAGLFSVMAAAQQIGTIRWRGVLAAMPYVELLLGVGCIVLAFRTYRARRRGSLLAAITSLLVVPVVGGWSLFALTQGFGSCPGVVAPAAGALGAGIGFAALGAIHKTSDARQRLSDQGIDFGI